MAGDRPGEPARMKFSALNVDFSSQRQDPVGSSWPAHPGVKEG